MKLERDEYANVVKSLIGDRTDDESLSIVENLMDSYGAGGEAEASLAEVKAELDKMKADYEANDNAWRTRYRDRFFGGAGEEPAPEPVITPEPVVTDTAVEVTYDDIFVSEEE
ncbi:MAG: hypothetical protein NC311_10725 [Muribaculaceae bacterium]|nr:hypothetical protein [Muribaculaceae bacterium]MCM1511423.1 hypothetical protein [Clostridium sp.]